MTRNQIEYRKLLETQRSNLAQEILTRTRDQAGIEARLLELDETSRHNQVVEDQGLQQLGISRITAKANKLNAESNARNADVNARNAETNARNADVNLVNARVNAWNAETKAAELQETARSHLANEAIGRTNATANLMGAGAAQQQAGAALQNAQTNVYQAETARGLGIADALTSWFNLGINQQKLETEKENVASQIELRKSQADAAIAEAQYKGQLRTKAELESQAQEKQNKWINFNNIMNAIDKGSESLRDTTTAVKNGVSIYQTFQNPVSGALGGDGGNYSYFVWD